MDVLRRVAGPLAAMVIVAAALAVIEAAIVVDLRELIAPIRQRHFPQAAYEMLPVMSLEQLDGAGDRHRRLLAIEVLREPMPLIVLLALGRALSRRRGGTLAYFLVGFGVWDILYYACLRFMIGWPASVATWDLLYLIPVPWVAPVWAPLAVSAAMAAGGAAMIVNNSVWHSRPRLCIFQRFTPEGGRATWVARMGSTPSRLRAAVAWVASLLGAAVVLWSFLAGMQESFTRVPEHFACGTFWSGWCIGVVGLAMMAAKRKVAGHGSLVAG